MRRVT